MGNICSVCFPSRNLNKNRPSSLQCPELSGKNLISFAVSFINYVFFPGIPNLPTDTQSDQEGSPISITAQCHVSRSCSQSQIPVTKSETFSLLGNHQGVSCTSSISKSDKRSLASKLSGSLNRSNSGKPKTITVTDVVKYWYLQSLALTLKQKYLPCMKSTRTRRKTAFCLMGLRSSA